MERVYKFRGTGLNKAEKKRAKRRFDKYCKAHNYETLNDLELLESLIFHELLIDRIKEKIEDLGQSKTVKDSDIVPKHIMEQLRELEDHTLKIRDKLGLFEQKKRKDLYQIFTDVEKKFDKHREENKLDYSIPCPFCQEMLFFMFKVKEYHIQGHPFFKGKFLTNDYLWNLYKVEKKVTKEDLAKIYGTTVQYIDFLEKKIYLS